MQPSQENFDAFIRNLPADGASLVIVDIMTWLAETEVSALVNYTYVVILACLTE